MPETTPQQAQDYRIAIAARLRDMAKDMINTGGDMDYYGGFNSEIAQHGRELIGAGMIVLQWADEIAAAVGVQRLQRGHEQ